LRRNWWLVSIGIAGSFHRNPQLNRLEMLPWDVWGMMPRPTGTISEEDGRFLDRVAVLTIGGDDVIGALRAIYDDPRVKVPSRIFNADRKIEEDLPIYIRQK
jgi:hypothetical protein